eukprot:444881-Hanusia_phi.AAC.1
MLMRRDRSKIEETARTRSNLFTSLRKIFSPGQHARGAGVADRQEQSDRRGLAISSTTSAGLTPEERRTSQLLDGQRKHGVFSDTSGSERSLGREEVTIVYGVKADADGKKMNFWEESQASERASSMSYDGREDDFLRPSHGSAHQSVQELTFAQFIVSGRRRRVSLTHGQELLRLKGLLPAVVSEREAAEAFRRTIAVNDADG